MKKKNQFLDLSKMTNKRANQIKIYLTSDGESIRDTFYEVRS